LDTFPYNGMTTTADCICQGIPAVSLAGEAAVSRTGASLLTAVGLTRCIAATPDQYVSTATALADDLDALQTLRETLRRRMGLSPLCDGKAVAARLEAALMGIIA